MTNYGQYQRQHELLHSELDSALERNDIDGFRATLETLRTTIENMNSHTVLGATVLHKKEFERLLLEYQNIDLNLRLCEERTKREETQRKLNAVMELVKDKAPELYKTIYFKE